MSHDQPKPQFSPRQGVVWFALGCSVLACIGCGTTKSYTATDQLLMSDAVDSTVCKIDFRPLQGQKIYLDTSYLTGSKTVPGMPNPMLGPQNLINSDYVISSVRQQMIGDGCLLEEKKDDADLIVEVRIGALGTDGHSVTYGIPGSNMLSAASTVISGTPAIPAFPEISVAKREMKSGAAKLAVFAYDRVSHCAVWQSGIEQANSNARDTWFLGIGPIQQGTIYKSARFAGRKIYGERPDDSMMESEPHNGVTLKDRYLFSRAKSKGTAEGIATKQPALSSGPVPPSGSITPPSSISQPNSSPSTSNIAVTPNSNGPQIAPIQNGQGGSNAPSTVAGQVKPNEAVLPASALLDVPKPK